MAARKKKCPTPGKVSFRDEIAAKLVIIRRQDSAHRRDNSEIRTYHCACGYWHLTSQPERGRK